MSVECFQAVELPVAVRARWVLQILVPLAIAYEYEARL